jgi:hypothetical protein
LARNIGVVAVTGAQQVLVDAPLEGVDFLLDAIGFTDPAEHGRMIEVVLADYEDFHYLVDDCDIDFGMWEFAQRLVHHHGIKDIWVGVETSALQSATEKALYFFAYTALKQLYTSSSSTSGGNGHSTISTLANLALGCLAEWAHLPITLPMDCWTTQIQTNNPNHKSALTLLTMMLSEKVLYTSIHTYMKLCAVWNGLWVGILTIVFLFRFCIDGYYSYYYCCRVSKECTRALVLMLPYA